MAESFKNPASGLSFIPEEPRDSHGYPSGWYAVFVDPDDLNAVIMRRVVGWRIADPYEMPSQGPVIPVFSSPHGLADAPTDDYYVGVCAGHESPIRVLADAIAWVRREIPDG